MYCENCGNKIEEDEKFCGKCGQPVSNNNIEKNTTTKPHIKIKFTNLMLLIGIVTIVFMMIIFITVSKNNSLDKKNKTTDNLSQNNSSVSNTVNKKLDIIDAEKQAFKININELSNKLIKIKDDEETANREPWKSEYELISNTIKDANGDNAIAYGLVPKLGKSNPYYKLPFQFVADNNGNIFRIFVLHEYQTSYGSSSLSSSENLYKWLYKALNNLGANDLVNTIENLKKEQFENASKYVPDENGKIYIELNGITITVIDAGNNQYGVSAGKYLGFCVR